MLQDEGSDSSDDSDEEADAAADRRAQETSRHSAQVHRRFLLHPIPHRRTSFGPSPGENPGFHGTGLGELEEAGELSKFKGRSERIARIM